MSEVNKILSISIAAYNVEQTIERALDSLLAPSILEDIEIFVVDDGGKDGTLDIAKKYAVKYPHTVYPVHKENGGYGSTINCSVTKATGKYFKQLDGDDWFITENFVEFVGLLKRTEADCILTEVADYKAQSGEQIVYERFADTAEGLYHFAETPLDALLTMHGTTIRTAVLRENNIRIIEHCFYSDTELVVLPMPYLHTFYLWKKPLYVYLTGTEGQSMSISGIRKHYRDHEKVFLELLEAYRKIPAGEGNKKSLVYRRLKKEAVIHYHFLMRLDISREHFHELRLFFNRIETDITELYAELIKERRDMRIMWKTKYMAYPVLSGKEKKKYKSKE